MQTQLCLTIPHQFNYSYTIPTTFNLRLFTEFLKYFLTHLSIPLYFVHHFRKTLSKNSSQYWFNY